MGANIKIHCCNTPGYWIACRMMSAFFLLIVACTCNTKQDTVDWTGIVHEDGAKVILEDVKNFSDFLQSGQIYNDMLVTHYHSDGDTGYFDAKIRSIEMKEGKMINRSDIIEVFRAPLESPTRFQGSLISRSSASPLSQFRGTIASVNEEREIFTEIEESEDGPIYKREIALVNIIQLQAVFAFLGNDLELKAEYVVNEELMADGCFDMQRRCKIDMCSIGLGIKVPCNPRCQVRVCGCGKKAKCGPWHKDNLGLMCSIGIPICS